jgi:hypothetical protein
MNMWKQIMALFFMGVTCIMMLHNALPHVHHTHEAYGSGLPAADHEHHYHDHAIQHSGLHSEQNGGYHSDHDARHTPNEAHLHHAERSVIHSSDAQANDADPNEMLFSFRFDNHSHSFHSHESLQLRLEENNYSISNRQPTILASVLFCNNLEYENQSKHRFALFKQVYYENPVTLNPTLRGPPCTA